MVHSSFSKVGWYVTTKGKRFEFRQLLHEELLLQLKLLFKISVARDHLLFMTEIPCTHDSIQKRVRGERLPAEQPATTRFCKHGTIYM